MISKRQWVVVHFYQVGKMRKVTFENNGRCNLGVVTLNLPRMALESAGNMTKFWEIFYERIDVLHDALLCGC